MSMASTISFEALYGEHSAWLRQWLSRYTRCSHRAADLTQDTFCKLLENRAAVTLCDPRSYLSTVARRLLIDDIRRRDVERAIIDACALRDAQADHITPDRIADAIQILDAVSRILESLPEQARTAFLLRRLERLEQKDIAERLGISLSTVKRHIALAYARCYAVAYAD